jgi:hypothetical protein
LGLIGGFVLGILDALCISSYLYLLSQAVAGSRITLGDARRHFASLFFQVIGVLFVLWIVGDLVGFAASAATEHAAFITAAYGLAVAVFFNPVPEIIYQSRTPGRTTDVLLASFRFVQASWTEWFLPNVLFAVALIAIAFGTDALNTATLVAMLPSFFSLRGVYQLAPSLLAGEQRPWLWPVLLAVVHYVMVFRGVLFRELATGAWRVRSFRARLR